MIAYIFTWMFVFAVPWENVVLVTGVGTISRLLGIGAFGMTLVHVVAHARVRRLTPFHWVAAAFLCWVLLSSFWAVNDSCHPEKGCDVVLIVRTYVQLFMMLWVVWEVTNTRARLILLLQAYVLGAYVAATNTIYNYAHDVVPGQAYGRFAATGFDANDLGMMLALALPMAWYIAASPTTGALQRWLNRVYFVIGGVAILLTGSRGALLATMVALLVVPWTLTQVRRGVRIAAVVVMLVVGVAAVRFVPAVSFERLATVTTEIAEGNLNDRLRIWKIGILVMPGRPFHGYGPAGWRTVLSRHGVYKGAHNTYLAVLVEEGLIGLCLYLGLYALLLRGLLTLPILERRVGLVLLATLATAITPLDWDTKKPAWIVLSLLAAYVELLAPGRRLAHAAARRSLYSSAASRRPPHPSPPALK